MEHEVCTASGDDIEASASAGSSYCSAEEDGEIVEIDEAVTEHIDTVLGVTCCENDCIASHPEAVTNFLRGYMKMTKDCQRTSLVTALAMCLAFSEDNQRHRSTGVRQRYAYFVPLVSQVCRTAFKTAYNVSNDTINRYGIKTGYDLWLALRPTLFCSKQCLGTATKPRKGILLTQFTKTLQTSMPSLSTKKL
ncbi:hypothetical protein Pcac1_g14469 [Phytophthora cactorum]|nr:hypothetical protein Pcac1_g14469 [Phytophthora cactorum]